MHATNRPPTARGFLWTFLRTFLVVAALYLLFVRVVDPRGELGTGLLPPSIDNARVSKLRLFEKYRASGPVSGLILGSSRSMRLPPRRFEEDTGDRFFNFAVDNGTTEDFLATWRWSARKDPDLRWVVVGIDAYALFDAPMNDDLLRNDALMAAYHDFDPAFPTMLDRVRKESALYEAVFALPYFEASAYSVALQVAPSLVPPATTEDPDGVLRDLKFERRRASGQFRLSETLPSSVAVMRVYVAGAGPFSERKLRALEQLVQEATHQGARVSLWITCLHPAVVAAIRRDTPYDAMLERTREVLRDLHDRYGAGAYDFSSPDRFGGSPDAFADGGHVDEASSALIVDALARDAGRGLQL